MFKQENSIWIYLIGIIVSFALLAIVTTDLIPQLRSNPFSFNILFSLFQQPPQISIDTKLTYYAEVKTNLGNFQIELFDNSAPENVNNFISLAKSNQYNRTKFHRLIKNYFIQGGDRNTLNTNLADDGFGNPGYILNDEINWDNLNLSNDRKNQLTQLGFSSNPKLQTPKFERYFVAMANSGPNTNGSQFFILLVDKNDKRIDELNGKFTPIGKVISGFDTLDKINNISVNTTNPNLPRPSSDITINQVLISSK